MTPGEVRKPKLYDFITVRPERFGAIVYNPFLGIEEEFDRLDGTCVRFCDGHNSLPQIETGITRRYGLNGAQARKRLNNVLTRLGRMGALGLTDGPEAERPQWPDEPLFASDGPYLSAPKNVVWDVSYRCNLDCAHCLTASGDAGPDELDTEEALQLIDGLADAKVLSVSLSGGEPLLRPDLFKLIDRIAQLDMRVDMATNGFHLSAAALDRLTALSVFQIQVSIDGTEVEHDRLRGRRGSFARSCITIRRLRERGIQVGIGMTVTSENLGSVSRIIDLAVELGCTSFKAIPFLPAGRGQVHMSLSLDREGYRRLGETITTRSRELEGVLSIATTTTFPFLFCGPPAKTLPDGPMGCAAGYDTLSIGADGTAYPCPFLHDFPLGSLRDQSLRHIWESAPVLHTLRTIQKRDLAEPCNTCEYAPLQCRGGCRAAAFLQHGDLMAADPTCFRNGNHHADLDSTGRPVLDGRSDPPGYTDAVTTSITPPSVAHPCHSNPS